MLGNKIFKRDTNGRMRFWQFEVEGAAWRSHSGLVDGETVTSGWTTCTPKSRDTAEAQALFEAEAEMGKKLDKDYVLAQDRVDDVREAGGKVMLAQTYEGFPTKTTGVYSQPKLDGMRCKVNRHGMWSRTGKQILSCPHIWAILSPAFVGMPDLELDGELYNHDLRDDFPKLMSILRKSKPTDEDIAEAAKTVQYHLYDIAREDRLFSERNRMLDLFVTQLGAPEIVLVPTDEVRDATQVDHAYGTYLQAGYEGQIIRLDGRYERKRSKLLLKRKEFETQEFKLLAIEAGNGNWAGLAKKITFELEDGRTCGAGIRGNAERAAQLLERAPDLIGKPVTVQFFTRSPDGVPRFPVAIDFDRPDNIEKAA